MTKRTSCLYTEPHERCLPRMAVTAHGEHMLFFPHPNTLHWCFLPPSYLPTTSCEGKIIYSAVLNDFLTLFQCFCVHTSLSSLYFAFFALFFTICQSLHLCGGFCQCIFRFFDKFWLISSFLFSTIYLGLSLLICNFSFLHWDFQAFSFLHWDFLSGLWTLVSWNLDLDFPIRSDLGWVEILLLLLL